MITKNFTRSLSLLAWQMEKSLDDEDIFLSGLHSDQLRLFLKRWYNFEQNAVIAVHKQWIKILLITYHMDHKFRSRLVFFYSIPLTSFQEGGRMVVNYSVVAIILIYRYLRFFKNHLIVSLGKIKIFLKNNLIVIKNKDF